MPITVSETMIGVIGRPGSGRSPITVSETMLGTMLGTITVSETVIGRP